MIKFTLGILCLFILALTSASGQTFKKFTLTGTIKGIKEGTIELYDHYGDDPDIRLDHKKTIVSAGKFEFKGEMNHPFKVYLVYSRTNGKKYSSDAEFFIDPGKEKLVCIIDSLHIETQIAGSKPNDEYNSDYLPYIKAAEKELDNWYAKYLNSPLENGMLAERSKIGNKIDSAVYNYASLHHNSDLVLWILDDRLDERYSDYYEKAYQLLDSATKNSHLGKTVAKTITGMKQTLIGATLPDMNLVDTTYAPVTVQFKTGLNSKYIFVELWFSHCGPCRREFPDLINIYNKYKTSGLDFIAISVRENNKQFWQQTIKTLQLPWTQYFDKDGIVLYGLNIHYFPSNFLIDQQGKIIAKDLQPFQLEKLLKEKLSIN